MNLIIPGAKSPLTIELVPSDYGPLFMDMHQLGYWLADSLPTRYLEHLAENLKHRAEVKRNEELASK